MGQRRMFGGLVDAPTINNAWRTHATLYPSAAMDSGEFLRKVLAGTYVLKSPASVSRSLLNFNRDRLRGGTASEMFPPGDRPRRDDHLVVSALSGMQCLSPVLIAVVGERHVLLDGQHRILAAKLAGEKVRACYVRLPSRARKRA